LTYNFLLDYVISYISSWCFIVQPVMIGVLLGIKALVSFPSDTVRTMQALLDQIGSSDPSGPTAAAASGHGAKCVPHTMILRS
jgi:hypothetical protein